MSAVRDSQTLWNILKRAGELLDYEEGRGNILATLRGILRRAAAAPAHERVILARAVAVSLVSDLVSRERGEAEESARLARLGHRPEPQDAEAEQLLVRDRASRRALISDLHTWLIHGDTGEILGGVEAVVAGRMRLQEAIDVMQRGVAVLKDEYLISLAATMTELLAIQELNHKRATTAAQRGSSP